MYRSRPLRSTLNTGYGYSTGLDMCKVCTEAVHSVALWTRVTLQVWACVKYIPKQSIAQRFEHVCKCKRMSSSPSHPTPTLSHVMCERVTLGGKNDAKLCLSVLVTPVCVRGWLWKMAVRARDSSLCARVTLGGACVHLWLQSVCAGDALTDTICIRRSLMNVSTFEHIWTLKTPSFRQRIERWSEVRTRSPPL